mgnify:CR=1 FL=1
MEHLSMEDILSFLEINELTESNLALAKRVNAHIVRCRKCARQVIAFHEIREAFGKESLKRQAEKGGSSAELD